jgi:hypothetical protein
MNEKDRNGTEAEKSRAIGPESESLVVSLTKIHFLVALVFFIMICLVNAWILNQYLVPPLSSMWDELARNYDTILPEARIYDGVAEVDEKQPIKIETNKSGTNVIIVDTREGHEKDAYDYLSKYREAIILSRTKVFMKTSSGRVQMVDLDNIPNMTINSRTIASAKEDYFPTVKSISYVVALIFSVFSKLFTVLLFALIPLFVAKSPSNPITYGQAMKLAIFTLAFVTLFDFVIVMMGFGFKFGFFIHIAIYLSLLLAASLSARAAKGPETDYLTPGK